MIAADRASQRPADAKLLVLDRHGRITRADRRRSIWIDTDALLANARLATIDVFRAGGLPRLRPRAAHY